jgi:hypothetical protein
MMLRVMKNPQKFENASGSKRPKLSSRPRKYVDVNDLRSMLRLGLGLHTVGDPILRLNAATDGLTRLAGADAWMAMVVAMERGRAARVLRTLSGGKDFAPAKAAAERIGDEAGRTDTRVSKFLNSPGQTPGRVLAVIGEQASDGLGAILSVLRPEETGPRHVRLTWISIHRVMGGPFEERERRMVELFHSQSAWLLLQTAE